MPLSAIAVNNHSEINNESIDSREGLIETRTGIRANPVRGQARAGFEPDKPYLIRQNPKTSGKSVVRKPHACQEQALAYIAIGNSGSIVER